VRFLNFGTNPTRSREAIEKVLITDPVANSGKKGPETPKNPPCGALGDRPPSGHVPVIIYSIIST
jgi:hypothetical protein